MSKRERFEPTPAYLTFLSKLRLARQEAGISQRELANRLGCHHSKINRAEAQPPQRALSIIEVRAWLQEIGTGDIVAFTRELDAALSAMEAEDASDTSVDSPSIPNSPHES